MGQYTFGERKEEIIRFALKNFCGYRYIKYINLRDIISSLGADLTPAQNEEVLRETIQVLETVGVEVRLHESFLDKVVNFFLGDR